jgi:short-subunit dehydrogenase
LELAKCCAKSGFDLLIAADEPAIEDGADELRRLGLKVEAVEADLATTEGVDKLCAAAGTLYMIHRAGNEMFRRNSGGILITG